MSADRGRLARRRAGTPVAGELAALLRDVGLDSDLCRLVRRPGSSRGTYLCLPTPARPQVLVPIMPAGAELVTERRSRTAAAHLAKQLVAAGLRSRAFTALPILRLAVHDPALDELITWVGGPPSARLGILAGPPRANRKPVLRLMADDGATLAFAKVGCTPITSALVHQEAAALAHVAGAGWRTVRAPQVIRSGEFRGRDVLVTSALAAAADVRQPTDLPVEPTREIATFSARHDLPLSATGILAPTSSEPFGRWGPELTTIADRLRNTVGDRRVPLGAAHGDWAPWNMAWSGELLEVWDWERFAVDVPQGFDAIHFAAARIRATEATDEPERRFLDELPESLSSTGVDPSLTRMLLALYLVQTARRYAADLVQLPVPAVEARLSWAIRLLVSQTDLIERGVLT